MALSKSLLWSALTLARRRESGEQPPYPVAALSFVLLAAPLYFVLASLLNQWGIPWVFAPIEHWLSRPERAAAFNIISPIVFLGALLSAILLNLEPLVSLGRVKHGHGAIPVVTLKIKYWNLIAVGLSLLLTLSLVGYAFVENVSSHGRF